MRNAGAKEADPPEQEATVEPQRAYLICCLPRSGSWMLADGLRRTGLGGRPEEYFWDALRPLYARLWGLPARVSQLKFMAAARRVGTSPNGVFGAKVHWFQMRQWLRRLQRLPGSVGRTARQLIARQLPSPRYVRLVREDKVRQAISYQAALTTGEWWKGRSGARAGNGHVDFAAVERLEWLLNDHETRWTQYFADSGIVPLVVTYEELCEDYPDVVGRVLRYLEIDLPRGFRVGRPSLTKQADRRTEETVHDYLTFQRSFGRSFLPPAFAALGRR